jgi:hypothetical protein
VAAVTPDALHGAAAVAAVTAALVLLAVPASAGDGGARMVYHLRHVPRPAPAAGEWRVHVRVTSLDASRAALGGGELGIELPPWGGWVARGRAYLDGVAGRPPLVPFPGDPTRWLFRLPERWDGTVEVRYRLKLVGTSHGELRSHPLLAFDAGGYCLGFAQNTLIALTRGNQRVALRRRLLVEAPRGWTVSTGWQRLDTGTGPGGPAGGQRPPSGRADIELDTTYDNGTIALGRAAGMASAERDGVRFQIVQYGRGPDLSGAVLDGAMRSWRAYVRETRVSTDRDVHLVVSDAATFGTHTGHGTHVPLAAGHADAPARLDAASARRVAHELFHRWLGTGLKATSPSLDWFKEGVTEYVAHWTAVHCGLAPETWFAGELLSMRDGVARNRQVDRVRLGEPDADWRRDPEREELIYKKAPLVAFLVDVALRRGGHGGILRLIGRFLGRTLAGPAGPLPGATYDLAAIRDELAALGLAELVRDHIDRPGVPGSDLDRALHAAGFRLRDRPVALTSVGLALEGGAPLFGRVAAVDRDGPAARAGVRPGDRITGLAPARPDLFQVRPAGPLPAGLDRYPYGLSLFEPGRPVFIDVTRDRRPMRLALQPRVIDGAGLRRTIGLRGPEADRFFARLDRPAVAGDGGRR